jgi:formylglycine-generating enzyme
MRHVLTLLQQSLAAADHDRHKRPNVTKTSGEAGGLGDGEHVTPDDTGDFGGFSWQTGHGLGKSLAVVLTSCVFVAAGAFVLAASGRTTPAVPELGRGQRIVLDALAARESAMECTEAAEQRMVRVPAGRHQPFYKQESAAAARSVDAFLLDERPVTRREFLAFVLRRPDFRKSRVEPLFAESAYLSDWRGDLDPGESWLDRPVTFVSWFAAKAYCECHSKRLPTVIEWEWAAGGDASSNRTARAPFRFAMGKSSSESGPELGFADVWEWTQDFNSVLISGRSDTGSGASLFCGDGYRANDARDYAGFLRHSFRASLKAGYTLKNLGFRCAKDAR